MPHINIKAEKITELFGFPITNSLLSTYVGLAFFLVVGFLYTSKLPDSQSRFVFVIRYLTHSLHKLFKPIMQDKLTVFFPLLASFFLFILFSNWFGLIPGVGTILIREGLEKVPLLRGATADLNLTIALAIIAFIVIQWTGMSYLGFLPYMKKFINLKNPINAFVGLLEIISEFSKIISFAFRLFGNIFAGEVLLTIIAFLVPVLASFPFLLLEVFVGLIQALVFAMLTAVFINMATVGESH